LDPDFLEQSAGIMTSATWSAIEPAAAEVLARSSPTPAAQL
jgi:hypothetical protein